MLDYSSIYNKIPTTKVYMSLISSSEGEYDTMSYSKGDGRELGAVGSTAI